MKLSSFSDEINKQPSKRASGVVMFRRLIVMPNHRLVAALRMPGKPQHLEVVPWLAEH